MKKQILIIILLLLNSLIVFIPIRGNPEGDNENLGWELLDDGAVLHIWNKHNSYYFDTDSGIQLTNHYEEYWTHNVMMLGYYDNEEWNLIYRTDALSGFNRDIDTDDSTYVNITIWKDLTYNSYNFRLAIRYCLGVDDNDLTIIPYIKNLGIEIPYILAFGWEIKDINIANVINDNYLQIYNGTDYERILLNQTLDRSFTDMDLKPYINFICTNPPSPFLSRNLYLMWNHTLNYKVTVKSRSGQYNAPTTLFIRVGTLAVGQEKSTKMNWLDADAWLGINSDQFDSECGFTDGEPVSAALDGSSYWWHAVNHVHWFILDLGSSYIIKRLRGRSDFVYDPIDVNIYIDNNNPPTTLVHEGITTWQDTEGFNSVDITDSAGRYIKVEIENTEDSIDRILFGHANGVPFSIFDVYGTLQTTVDSFNIDTEPGANSGWDLDNDDAQMDWATSDVPVTVYITFNKAGQARLPTTEDYDYHVQQDDATNKDCNWEFGDWSDYDGAIRVKIRAHDGTWYSVSTRTDILANGIDGTNPTGTIDEYGTENPSSIEGDSSDATSGVGSNDITIYNSTDDAYWTGSEWGSVTWLDCIGTTSWSYDSSSVTWAGGHVSIIITLRIYDNAGNVDASADTEVFTTNHIPNQLGEVPANQSINIGIIPDLYVLCTDANNDNLNATWWSNSSGSWLQFASNWTSFANNTNITQTNSNFSAYDTMYWWSVNVSDNTTWTNETYHFTTRGGATTSINASTGIEETNATLHGYISGNGSGNYNYGFWVGTTTPLTGGNADHNMTGSGYVTVTGNRDFSHNDTNLTQGIHYYVRAWVSNATCFGSSNNEEDFWTKCDAPSGFTATVSGCNITLAWTKGTGADKTTIVRKVDSYPTNQTDGTVIYNDSGVSYSDTTARGSHQYYRAWSWVGDKHSDGNASANIFAPPCPPTNVDTNVLSNNTFDIVWTKGVGAVNTVVRRKLNSRPSSVTDGIQVYNGTGTQINIQSILNYYYSLWSYANITYSSQVNITVGGIVLNCYDEETNESLYFDVSISNQDGSHTYERYNNTNPLIINISQLPISDDVKITISAASNYSDKSETFTGYPPDENYTITYIVLSQTADSKSNTNVTCINEGDDAHSYPSFTLVDDLITILPDNADKFTKIFVNYTHEEYSSRLYYRDIEESAFSFLNTYLPPTENKQLYLLEVIDEAGNTVSDAHIEVKRSVNGTFVVVSRLLTDANGQADIDLISGRNYIFIISKEGYITENASWTPSTSIFTHTFKIIWETTPFEPDTFGDIISFYGTLYVNNTMMVTFYDLNNEMIDSHFTIYENYNGTLTYMGEYNGTTSNDITFWINVDNATRLHIIILYMNHSTLREVINYRIFVYPIHIDREGGTWLENLIVSVVGDFDYGYVITLIWFLPCVLLIAGLASIGHPGTGIIGAGLYSMWITWNITLPEEAKILTFASIAIVVGFITIVLVKGTKVVH